MAEEHRIEPDPDECDGQPVEAERDPIDFDELFDLLSRKRRRYALYYCHETSDAIIPIDALVEELLALERHDAEPHRSRDEIALTLQHAHLPKLEAASVLEYDPDAELVEYRGGPRVDEWIGLAADAELGDECPWTV